MASSSHSFQGVDNGRRTSLPRNTKGENTMPRTMTLKECLEIVRDLAVGNMVTIDMAEEDNGALWNERERQREAIDRVYQAVEIAYSNPKR